VCRASAVDRSKRTSGPPIRTPTDNAMKRHEHPALISKPGAAGCLPTYLPTSSCYSGWNPGGSRQKITRSRLCVPNSAQIPGS
jgi:hypothetical protein